jgi:DNA-binding transcriptional LysR family regulator
LRIDLTTGRKLTEGEADLAIGLLPDLEAGFFPQNLFAQDWICLARSRQPRIGERFTRADYERESHVEIASGAGYRLLDDALSTHDCTREMMLNVPGFLGLGGVLVSALPRQIGETLARTNRLRVLACPFPIPTFALKQHWRQRYHQDSGGRWLRGVCVELFLH